jgi:transposase
MFYRGSAGDGPLAGRKRCAQRGLQSTGVYWAPVFEVLEHQGLEVYLVNAQHTKNVPGRKSHVDVCL